MWTEGFCCGPVGSLEVVDLVTQSEGAQHFRDQQHIGRCELWGRTDRLSAKLARWSLRWCKATLRSRTSMSW
jgi:hypothetical protein